MKIKIAQGMSEKSSVISMQDTTTEELYGRLADPTIKRKKNGPYYVLASFKGDTRNNSEICYMYGATVDLDNTDLEIKDIKKKLKPLKCSYVVHTTHSHITKGNRYRIVIPYANPVRPADHILFLEFAFSLFAKHGADNAAKTLSQPVFWPACTRSRRKDFEFYKSRYDTFIDPTELPDEDPREAWMRKELAQTVQKEKLDISGEVSEGGRNTHLARIVGKLINNGDTKNQILIYASEVNAVKFEPPLPDKEVKQVVERVWNTHVRNHGDSQWGFEQIKDLIEKGEVETDPAINMIAESSTLTPVELDILMYTLKQSQKGTTINTIRGMLKEKKRVLKEEQSANGELEEDPDFKMLKKKYGHYVYVESARRVFNRSVKSMVELEAFNIHNDAISGMFPFIKKTPFEILKEKKVMISVERKIYKPGKEAIYKKNGVLYANTYESPLYKPKKGRVSPMLRHFEYLLPNPEERAVLLDFIAYNLQNPGEKIRWAPILKGKKGIGKSMICDYMLRPLFGAGNIRAIGDNNVLFEKFNKWKSGSQIVVVQELSIEESAKKKRLMTDTLKSFITDENVDIRAMREDAIEVPNTTNLMAFTNEEDAVSITADERRFCMLRCDVSARSSGYYKRLIRFFRKNMPAVSWFFHNRCLADFNPGKVPETLYTQMVKDASRSIYEEAVDTALDEETGLISGCKAIPWKALHKLLLNSIPMGAAQMGEFEGAVSGKTYAGRKLVHALIERGFERHTEKGKPYQVNLGPNHGGLQYVWFPPGSKAAKNDLAAIAKKTSDLVDKKLSEF